MKSELEHLDEFVREAMMYPHVPVPAEDVKALIDNMLNRPTLDTFPDVEILVSVVTRLLSDEKRLKELEQTPFKPGISLLQFLLQVANEFTSWKQSQPVVSAPENAA
jgi:hypothetical protein